VDDNVSVWRIKVASFDEDLPAGRQLNRDLAQLRRQFGADHGHVLLELR